MTDNDALVACRRAKEVFETQLREAAPIVAQRYERLLKNHCAMLERFKKEEARLSFEEDMRRELAAERKRIRDVLFKLIKDLPELHVKGVDAMKNYNENLPSWA